MSKGPSYNMRRALDRQRAKTVMRESRSFWAQAERAVLLGTFVSIIIGVIAFLIDTQDRQEAREDRKSEAISRAWSILASQNPGNSGKIEALEFLHNRRVALPFLDLSCARMAGSAAWNETDKTCSARTYLRYLDFTPIRNHRAWLRGAQLQGVDMVAAKMQEAVIHEANLDGALLHGVDFTDAVLKNTSLQRSNLNSSNLTNADLTGANLSGASLRNADLMNTKLRKVDLSGAHISNVDFSSVSDTFMISLEDVWAWADEPPQGLNGVPVRLCVFQWNNNRIRPPIDCIAPE